MVEAFARRGPLLGHHLQHGQQEVREVAGVFLRPAVLLHQHVEQRPRLQLGDVPELTCRGGGYGLESMIAAECRKKREELSSEGWFIQIGKNAMRLVIFFLIQQVARAGLCLFLFSMQLCC